MISSLSNLTHKILNCDNDFLVMRDSVQQLYNMFKEIAQVDIENYNSNDIYLPSGKALSSSYAAHCLLEMKRTAVFLRGIKKAIDFELAEKNGKPIRILYAGTGPYATLVTPLLPLYSSELVKVDFIEINPISMQAAKRVVEHFGLTTFVEHYYVCDAATFTVAKPYDVVISETMQCCLHNEPQVAIMQNLIPQCSPSALFIPEQITIDAQLYKRGTWDGDQLIDEGGAISYLGEIFRVDKQNLDASKFRGVISIPHPLKSPHDVLLCTTIRVYNNEVLGFKDCSLNTPLKYYEIRDGYEPRTIEFWYNQSEKSVIESKVLDYIG